MIEYYLVLVGLTLGAGAVVSMVGLLIATLAVKICSLFMDEK